MTTIDYKSSDQGNWQVLATPEDSLVVMPADYKYWLHIIVFITSCFLATPVFAGQADWKKYPAGSSQALAYETNYIKQHRYDLDRIYKLANDLYKHRRFLEAVHVYKSALVYYPGHSGLKRDAVLAESDWQESKSSKDHKILPDSSTYITKNIDKIKCRTLKNEEGTNACLRLKNTSLAEVQTKPVQINNESIVKPEAETKSHENKKISVKKTVTYRNIDVDIGNFHALVIGNEEYRDFPSLKTAKSDATAVTNILKNKYNFKVTTLNNADRYLIFQELSRLRRNLGETDNLLIYYAGHGYLDEQTQRGYWLPVDAEQHNYANWLSTNDITDMLSAMSARHVLVVADSCYSGTLTRGIHTSPQSIDPAQLEWIQRIASKRSRSVMTSGGLEPVLDSGHGNSDGQHSVFADAFLKSLNENAGIIEASRMFENIRRSVILNADQTPEYADIRKAGHEGGDFIFIRTN